jgi:hypothetical protein
MIFLAYLFIDDLLRSFLLPTLQSYPINNSRVDFLQTLWLFSTEEPLVSLFNFALTANAHQLAGLGYPFPTLATLSLLDRLCSNCELTFIMASVNAHLSAKAVPAINFRSFKTLDIDWREFHQFAKLPRELRLMIWEYALPDPRVVTIEKVSAPMNPRDYRISCDDCVPSTLLVNHESHEACRARYTLSFATFGDVHGPPVYFDFSRDVISLSKCGNLWWTDFNEIFNRDLSSVRRVMIDDGGFGVFVVLQLVLPFHELRSIGMVREIYLPPLDWQEENHLLSAFKAQIKRENLQDYKHKVLEKFEVYFLSRLNLYHLEKGKKGWEA